MTLYILAALVLAAAVAGGMWFRHTKRDETLLTDSGAARVLADSARAGEAAQEAEDEAFRKASGRSRLVARARKRLGL